MSAIARSRTHRGNIVFGYLLFAAVAARMTMAYYAEPRFPVVVGLLAAVLVLYATEPLLSRRLPWYRYLYFPLQTGLGLALGLQPPYTDFWGILYAVFSLQAVQALPRRTLVICGTLWAAAVTGITALTMSWPDGLTVALMIDAAGLFIISYAIVSEEQERAREESQALLLRLQAAHARLEEYAAQAEGLAGAEERNRLAHELRDSVNQQLFAITLAASSARLLLDREPARVPAQLDQLQELTASALGKMRALIAQLRPKREE